MRFFLTVLQRTGPLIGLADRDVTAAAGDTCGEFVLPVTESCTRVTGSRMRGRLRRHTAVVGHVGHYAIGVATDSEPAVIRSALPKYGKLATATPSSF